MNKTWRFISIAMLTFPLLNCAESYEQCYSYEPERFEEISRPKESLLLLWDLENKEVLQCKKGSENYIDKAFIEPIKKEKELRAKIPSFLEGVDFPTLPPFPK
jgi:hypothetical protein